MTFPTDATRETASCCGIAPKAGQSVEISRPVTGRTKQNNMSKTVIRIQTPEEIERLQTIKTQLAQHEAEIAAAKQARIQIKKLNEEAKTILRGGPPKKRAPRKPKAQVDEPATA